MSDLTCQLQECTAAICEESHRLSALGPVLTRDQAAESVLLLRLSLASLEGLVHQLPSEHPAVPLPALSQLKGWP